jgi:hypothetical protein
MESKHFKHYKLTMAIRFKVLKEKEPKQTKLMTEWNFKVLIWRTLKSMINSLELRQLNRIKNSNQTMCFSTNNLSTIFALKILQSNTKSIKPLHEAQTLKLKRRVFVYCIFKCSTAKESHCSTFWSRIPNVNRNKPSGKYLGRF